MNKQALIQRLVDGYATSEELQQFEEWLMQHDDAVTKETVNLYFKEALRTIRPEEYSNSETVEENLLQRIRNTEDPAALIPAVHRVHFLKTAWFRIAAAVLLFAGIGAYVWLQPSTDKAGITETKPVPAKKDVLPGGDKAILRLADGSEILLDSAANGQLAQQVGANIVKTNDGQIVYSFNNSSLSPAVSYNTMSTPRGGQYQLELPDGSKVWLNAESSITFPTAFMRNSREVSITGEAYFEVKPNKEKPFMVKTRADEISVLGTSFNVNAYLDEPLTKTSLLEGSVKVNSSLLRPGQAYVNGRVVNTNLAQDVAWKNGAFNFEDMDLKAAFRLLGRWYDVEVKYAGTVPTKEIRGEMGRDLTLSEVLNALNELGIHTKIEGTTLVVLPE